MTEVRRVAWPAYETNEYSAKMFLQGIAGTLELFHLSLVNFQNAVEEATGNAVAVYQRVDQAGQRLPIDERILADTDTLMIFGLDHMVAEEEASPAEIAALEDFLEPRRDVSRSRAPSRRRRVVGSEGSRHGIPPSRRRAGAATATLREIRALADERARRAGRKPLRAATGDAPGHDAPGTDRRSERFRRARLADGRLVVRVPHAPAALRADRREPKGIHVLARQPVDLSKPHPFTEAGNREINMFLWIPPAGKRAGDILFADSTIFTTLFGGDESLTRFWQNLATK